MLELEDKVSDGKILDVEEALVRVEDKDMLTPEHFESPPKIVTCYKTNRHTIVIKCVSGVKRGR